MARDSNGNYTLPAGNPVTPGTEIEAAWANTTMDDLAAAMTDSLSRTGQGGMLSAFENADGTVANPGISWANEPTSGWYRAAFQNFWYSVGNENIFQITKTGIALAAGKTAVGIAGFIAVADVQPVGMPNGEQWFESDTGMFVMQYQNPDTTKVLVASTGAGGDFIPYAMLGSLNTPGFRNRVINGDMRIDQANAGAVVSVNSATVVYGPDMWEAAGTPAAGVFSMQQLATTPPAGFKDYLRVTVTTADAAPAAGSAYTVRTKVEGLNVIDFDLGKSTATQFTTSMQLRSSLTGTFSGAFVNAAGNRSYPWTCTITTPNVWTPIVATITGDLAGTWLTDNTVGLATALDIGSGSNFRFAAGSWQAVNAIGVTGAVRLISTLNATLDITGVQIEKGATASVWDYRDFEAELARCKRYFAKTFPIGVAPAPNSGRAGALAFRVQAAGAGVSLLWRYPTEMRIVPVITTFNTDAVNANVRDWTTGVDKTVLVDPTASISASTVFISDSAGSALNDLCGVHATANARL